MMWTILTGKACKFCSDAKMELEEHDIEYKEFNLHKPENQFLLNIMNAAKVTSVPQIFDEKGSHIGGLDSLRKVFSGDDAAQGKLPLDK